MNANQLRELARNIKLQENNIKVQEYNLAQTKMVFNMYEKINYFKSNFDENCLLNLHIGSEKGGKFMSIIAGNHKNNIIVLTSDIIAKHINIYFPPENSLNYLNSMSFNNNQVGFENFIKTVFKENYAYFNAVSLELNLHEKTNNKTKIPKI